jgi:hypothetical protein
MFAATAGVMTSVALQLFSEGLALTHYRGMFMHAGCKDHKGSNARAYGKNDHHSQSLVKRSMQSLLFTTFIYHGHAVVLHKQARLSALNTRISYQQHNYWFRITDLVEAHIIPTSLMCHIGVFLYGRLSRTNSSAMSCLLDCSKDNFVYYIICTKNVHTVRKNTLKLVGMHLCSVPQIDQMFEDLRG